MPNLTKLSQQEIEGLLCALDQHDLVCISDASGRITEINELFAKKCGYSREELLGQDFRLLHSGQHPKAFFDELWQTINAGKIWKGDLCNRHKNGSLYWIAATIAPVLDEEGRLSRFIMLNNDLADVKNMEQRLQFSELKFRTLSETMPAVLFVHRGGKIRYANPATLSLSGFTNEELLGMEYWEIAHPDSQELIRSRGAARMRGEQVPSHYEFRFNTKDGREAWVDITAVKMDYEGTPAVLCTCIDITERKATEIKLRNAHVQLEQLVERRTAQLTKANATLEEDMHHRMQTEAELLKRNTELMALNKRLHETQNQLMQTERLASIGQLAAGVAHEINNPIGYVYSNMGSLERYLNEVFLILDAYVAAEPGLAAGTPAHAKLQKLKSELDLNFLREDIPVLMGESREGLARVRKIVQDLKDFSRVDSSQEWQWVDLHKGLDSTLNVVNNEIKYKADVVKEYGDIPQIECLPSQLNQVFMNLLVNAAHAIADNQHGKITLRTGSENGTVWVEVSDTGSGIAPENLQRIFDPFFTTKPVGKGTGLGLSLSYGIVQKHGGRIEVSSELGKGSTFLVVLPLQRTHESDNAENTQP